MEKSGIIKLINFQSEQTLKSTILNSVDTPKLGRLFLFYYDSRYDVYRKRSRERKFIASRFGAAHCLSKQFFSFFQDHEAFASCCLGHTKHPDLRVSMLVYGQNLVIKYGKLCKSKIR